MGDSSFAKMELCGTLNTARGDKGWSMKTWLSIVKEVLTGSRTETKCELAKDIFADNIQKSAGNRKEVV